MEEVWSDKAQVTRYVRRYVFDGIIWHLSAGATLNKAVAQGKQWSCTTPDDQTILDTKTGTIIGVYRNGYLHQNAEHPVQS